MSKDSLIVIKCISCFSVWIYYLCLLNVWCLHWVNISNPRLITVFKMCCWYIWYPLESSGPLPEYETHVGLNNLSLHYMHLLWLVTGIVDIFSFTFISFWCGTTVIIWPRCVSLSEMCCILNFFADVLVHGSLSKQSVSWMCLCVCVCVWECLLAVCESSSLRRGARAASCWSHGAPW